jgi:hypothetical protein
MNEPRRSARARLTALAVTAAAAAALPMTALASSDAAAALPRGIKICGTFSGPHWAYKGAGGTQYIAYTRNGAACPFALKWAPRLVTKLPHGPTYAITGAPPGWACSNSSVHFGICTLKVGGRPVPSGKTFAWAGKSQ